MDRDAKDFIIGELEFQLSTIRGRFAQAQLLTFLLERHSHVPETKLSSATITIKLLSDQHRQRLRLSSSGCTSLEDTGFEESSTATPSLHEEGLAKTQQLNCVLEKQCHLLEQTVQKLRVKDNRLQSKSSTTGQTKITECDIENCGTTFTQKRDLERHISSRHPIVGKKFACDIEDCSKMF